MTETQVEYARVILASGNDLLSLLNRILEMAKAESGTVAVEMVDVPVGRAARHSAARVRAARPQEGPRVPR